MRRRALKKRQNQNKSNAVHLVSRYEEHPSVKKIADAVLSPAARLQLTGLTGAQESFAIAGAVERLKKEGFFHLIIAEDREAAAYLQNNLGGLLPSKTAHFFPDSFKRPAFFDQLNSANVLQRSETVNKITAKEARSEVIVTYPEALFEKVVSPDVLSENRIEITKGERVDVDFVIEVLVNYGFERADFVHEPGQFSIRGGIVDLFSFGNELPFRIELFDDEVESIRVFDPLTQLSVQNLSKVSIVPNIQTRFRSDQKVSFLQILPEKTIVWARDFDALLERLQECFERAEKFAVQVSAFDEAELREIFRDRAFLFPQNVIDDVKTMAIVQLKRPLTGDHKNYQKIAFSSSPQQSFNRNFELLMTHLKDNTKTGFENFIFSENSKQFDRFRAIFKDLQERLGVISWAAVSSSLSEGFIDLDLKIACLTDHQIFQRFHQYKLRQGFSKEQSLNVRLLRELTPGDFVTHIDHGVGKFSGLQKIEIGGNVQESVRLIYKNNDILYVSIHSLHKISKFVGKDGEEPTLNKLGSDAWKQLKARTKKKIKDIAAELIKLYAKRRYASGHAFPPDGYLQNELEASFIYEDTPDQVKSTADVKSDMEKPYPMDRLICGDVGFGKTEVAIRAAFKAVTDGKQVAILCPTTILALQHNKTFSERLSEFGCDVDYVNRFRSAKEKKEIFEKCKAGKIDVLIGTHAILSKELEFKDLGLLIIDEEQKFGVAAKEKLRTFKVNVDTLTLTATPIPRTLQFSLMAARDLSVIRTPPPNRQPIHTEVRQFNEELIKDAIYYEINRGGQVFFVYNRVKKLPEMMLMLQKLCPDIDIKMAHGQMDDDGLEKVLIDFIDKKFDVLCCTNIIETGLDVSNANTIIIFDAHQYGLSDLHQLRGRVGRSNTKAFCYLFAPPLSMLTTEAKKRLRTVEEFSDLGSGFQIAMRDLDIRGAGNLLGGEQSGFIADIGFEAYQKILDEAIQELKATDFKDLFKEELAERGDYVRDVVIETDVEMLIPETYVSNGQERLSLYTELDALTTEAEIDAYRLRLIDRFGKLPRQVESLFEALRLRWACKKLGFERLIYKGGKLRLYFLSDPQSSYFETALFQKIMAFVAKNGRLMGLSAKQTVRELILAQDDVRSLKAVKSTMEQLLGLV